MFGKTSTISFDMFQWYNKTGVFNAKSLASATFILNYSLSIKYQFCIYIWDPTCVITVPADDLVPNGARPSADTVMAVFQTCFCPKFLYLMTVLYNLYLMFNQMTIFEMADEILCDVAVLCAPNGAPQHDLDALIFSCRVLVLAWERPLTTTRGSLRRRSIKSWRKRRPGPTLNCSRWWVRFNSVRHE